MAKSNLLDPYVNLCHTLYAVFRFSMSQRIEKNIDHKRSIQLLDVFLYKLSERPNEKQFVESTSIQPRCIEARSMTKFSRNFLIFHRLFPA